MDRCCDKVTELAEVFLMFIKFISKGNENTFINCLSEMKSIIEEIQSTLILYDPKEKSTKNKIDQLKSISLKTSINITDIPVDLNKINSIKP